MSSTNVTILANPPQSALQLDESKPEPTFRLEKQKLEPLAEGQLLVRTIYLSNDPTQRAWIQKGNSKENLYMRPILPNEPMRAFGIGEVVESRSDTHPKGTRFTSLLTWADYSIINASDVMHVIKDTQIPLTWHLSALGVTGLTAYFGIFSVADLKSTDTIVISAASGATGSMCVQFAKKVVGARVIGISGGPEKCRWVESIGADVCVDYKDPKFYDNMVEALGEGKTCDVYFDSVGGKILDDMLSLTKVSGKVIACGCISGYNDRLKSVVNAWPMIIVRKLTVKGFIVVDYVSEFGRAAGDIAKWIQEGKISMDEKSIAIVDASKDLSKIPEIWGRLFTDAKGPGKLITQVTDLKV